MIDELRRKLGAIFLPPPQQPKTKQRQRKTYYCVLCDYELVKRFETIEKAKTLCDKMRANGKPAKIYTKTTGDNIYRIYNY